MVGRTLLFTCLLGAAAEAAAQSHDATAPAPPARQGYVPIGAARRTATVDHGASAKTSPGHPGSAKPKPVVSGASILMAKPAPEVSDGHGAPTAPHGTAPDAHDSTPATATGEANPVPPVTVAKPVRLVEVHERLTALLAEARKDSGDETASAGEAPKSSSPSREPHRGEGAVTPRLLLRWPEPRWFLIWPDAGRLDVAPPTPGPPVRSVLPEPR